MTALTLILLACSGATVKLGDSVTTGVTDDDTPVDADTAVDSGAVPDSGVVDDTGATKDSETTEPTPETNFSEFTGSRHFSYDVGWAACDETVTDEGVEVAPDHERYDELTDLCGACDHFYEVTPSTDTACDWIALGTTWRGIIVSDDETLIYLYTEGGDGLEEYGQDDDASFDGSDLLFVYIYDVYDIYEMEVSGTMTFVVE